MMAAARRNDWRVNLTAMQERMRTRREQARRSWLSLRAWARTGPRVLATSLIAAAWEDGEVWAATCFVFCFWRAWREVTDGGEIEAARMDILYGG